MNWIQALLEGISHLAEHLERFEHLLVRLGLAIWHVAGMLFFFYLLLADKIVSLLK